MAFYPVPCSRSTPFLRYLFCGIWHLLRAFALNNLLDFTLALSAFGLFIMHMETRIFTQILNNKKKTIRDTKTNEKMNMSEENNPPSVINIQGIFHFLFSFRHVESTRHGNIEKKMEQWSGCMLFSTECFFFVYK